MAEATPFLWSGAGERLTPEQVERKRRVAELLAKQGTDYSPVQHWTQGAARVAQAMLGGWEERKANDAEKANAAEDSSIMSGLVGGMLGGGAAASPAAAPSMAGGGAARSASMPAVAPEVKDGIVQTASALGIDPVDLATTISYETGGTFDPTKRGPTTKWGQHRGLIQFGEPQARQHGVDWSNPVGSQLGPNGAVASYLKTAGVKPGMGLLDIYSAINAGAPGLYNRSDAAAGGAPGTVRDKVEQQMSGHRAKALRLLGVQTAAADMPAADASVAEAPVGNGGFAVPPAPVASIPGDDPVVLRQEAQAYAQTNPEAARQMLARADAAEAAAPPPAAPPMPVPRPQDLALAPPDAPAMTAQTFNAITGEKPLDPVFQSEGVAQPWMGTALPPQQPAQPQMAQAPLPPRPTDLRADMPAPGAVPAIGQMPPPQMAPQPDFTTADNAGSRDFVVQQEQIRRGQAPAPQEAASPVSRVAAAFTGGGQQAAPAAAPAPAVKAVAQAVASNPGDPLVRALTSPYASEGTKKIAMAMLVKKLEGDNKSPIAVGKDQRLVDPRTGRVILDRDRNASDVKRSLAPVYGTDAEGNTVLLQPGDDGSAIQTKLPPGVKISSGVDKIDAGTEWLLYDKKTGQMVGRQAKDIAGAEGQKVEGKAAGEAKAGLGQALATAEQSLATIDAIRKHPGRDSWGAQGKTAALPIIGNGIPGTAGRDFVVMVDQLKGKAFLEAFESLKGGGQITEVEGAKAQAAIARLDRAQSREGFDAALKDLEDVIRGGIARSKQKAGASTTPPAATVDTSKPGSFKFNPATGKMEPM